MNSPNDAAPHPDGSIWFTDPPYGGQLYQGAPDAAGGGNPVGTVNPRLGQAIGIGEAKRELPTNVYRADPSGRLDVVVTEDQYGSEWSDFLARLQEALRTQHRQGPGDTGPGGKGDVHVFDVGTDNKLSNQKLFTDCMVDGGADQTVHVVTSTAMSGYPAMPVATSATTG